jgi:hypothetical protein
MCWRDGYDDENIMGGRMQGDKVVDAMVAIGGDEGKGRARRQDQHFFIFKILFSARKEAEAERRRFLHK